jgi:hypothetical protein
MALFFRFHVLASSMKMAVFWDVAMCSLVHSDRNFKGVYCLHHQDLVWTCIGCLLTRVFDMQWFHFWDTPCICRHCCTLMGLFFGCCRGGREMEDKTNCCTICPSAPPVLRCARQCLHAPLDRLLVSVMGTAWCMSSQRVSYNIGCPKSKALATCFWFLSNPVII